ncbi:MAG: TerB family tellurite resistance protein [Polyangiaceae bacterium]|nr:TerB family tellurite resistance protein [Polyangiaceae bacterium]
MSMREELIADLLMGAACADRDVAAAEVATVRAILCRALGASALPPELEARIVAFSPAIFRVEHAVGWLGLSDPAAKRQLLELIVAVRDADGVLDLEEDAYLRHVAEALGLPPEAYADLTLDVADVPAAGAALLGKAPPPLPRR